MKNWIIDVALKESLFSSRNILKSFKGIEQKVPYFQNYVQPALDYFLGRMDQEEGLRLGLRLWLRLNHQIVPMRSGFCSSPLIQGI